MKKKKLEQYETQEVTVRLEQSVVSLAPIVAHLEGYSDVHEFIELAIHEQLDKFYKKGFSAKQIEEAAKFLGAWSELGGTPTCH